MTTLLTGLNTTNKTVMTAINGRVYLANDFDNIKVITPDRATDAGITGPSGALGSPTAGAGNTTNGTHLIRYRYRDSRSGYISNPSDALSYTVSGGNGSLVFNVTSDYTASSDVKVDYIDFEMTPVDDSTFYRAQSILNTATTATVSLSDASLTQQFNASANYGSAANFDLFSNAKPPSAAVMASHRNILFVGGDHPYAVSASFTQSSATVNYSGGSSNWVGRLIQVSSDTVAYEISAVGSATMTLSAVYAGSTGTKSATVYKKLPNRIYYSRLNYPESFDTINQARDVLIGRGDRVRALYSLRDALYIFGQYSSDRLAFNTNPSAATSNLIPIKGNRGVFNQQCLVEADGRVFAWDRLGMYEVKEVPRHISTHIDNTLSEMVDYTEFAQFHGVYDPIERALLWFFVATGDTVPKFAATVEIDTIDGGDPRWQFHQYRQGITSSQVIASTDGQVRGWVGDENGYTWALSTVNTFDGVYPTNPGVVTAASGATTTVIPVDETLYTTVTLAGCILYDPSSGEERLISTNTASTITLATALTNAPSDGDELWLGSFQCEYRTKWWAGQGMQNKKRPSYFYLMLYPGNSTGKLSIYFYKDFSTQPFTFSNADNSYVGMDGVTFSNGVLTIDLDGGNGDGFVSVNMPSDWSRALQARVVSDRPDGTLRIMDMGFRTFSQDEVEVGNE